jgi:aryl-alcohol dehydrogenase-like predicted oxidoreductase
MTEEGFRVIDALDAVAAAHGTPIAAVALAWQLSKPAVASSIIGANSREQLADLLPAAELRLSDGELAALDVASAGM